ncbi:MAG: GNAT family N-acetyltransferase [Chloroflexota bacterium]
MSILRETALFSESLLFGKIIQPGPGDVVKALLGKALTKALHVSEWQLHLITSADDWQQYREHRVVVEAQFGGTRADVERMIKIMHSRQTQLSIQWYFLQAEERLGGVGLLEFEYQGTRSGRLQDIDIFPSYQGLGLGNVLLKAVEGLAYRKNLTYLYLGADTNDWPLYWYQRHGYAELARIKKVAD